MPKFGVYHFGTMDLPFWHTPDDTFDKLNKSSVIRDASCMLKLACYYIETEQLPADFTGFLNFMDRELHEIQDGTEKEFDLSPVWPYLEQVKASAAILEELMPGRNSDDIIIKAGGELTRLVYSYSSRYGHDTALPQPRYPKLSIAVGKTRDNTTPDYYLALQTTFLRHVNRLTGQLVYVNELITQQIAKWKEL